MTAKAKTKLAPKPPIKVEEVADSTVKIPSYDELLFTVKLDSKRFEARTLEQVLSLVEGSVGVVSKVTIERQ